MTTTQIIRGEVLYDAEWGHVCTCTKSAVCGGHPASVYGPDGEDFYCDGSCSASYPEYGNTIEVDRWIEPTNSGSYYYRCSRCGASGWSGC